MLKVKLNNKIYHLNVADNFIKRAFGLMFRDIGHDEGLIFYYHKRKLHIHTCFMKYPIDVVFLMDNSVVGIVKNLKPWKTYKSNVYSNAMIEIKSCGLDLKIGDKLNIIDEKE
ncbi:DUF192 domain-containing protein [Methanothermococcus okinawensis]|uniref:DUF192 domain-containing protein n=1 Tax=Methanothermococcus okinawensis (strain DSM 14208 / JCM 11175 / IH1) TaxID=647113 RepID=F8AM02_METOI|nr:DUF192 domain-containing protein [Methanothermococcus okinawensis]AEH06677.1 protein of unknown function DUF192 [Methanothermococcus okinawensis IH1]